MPQPIIFFFAFVAVLALIGAAAWLVRRFAGNRLGTNANRGRMPRLAVIDAAAVDGRRRLVLVRRDNVEHLLMIGGPTDIVVEPNIVRANPAREQAPQRPNLGAETPRIAPIADGGNWDDGGRHEAPEVHEPTVPELPQRQPRPSFIEEPRRPAPALAERRGNDPVPGFISEPMNRPEPVNNRPEPITQLRPEPRVDQMPRPAQRSEGMMPRVPRAVEPPVRSQPMRTPERAAAPPPPPPAPPASNLSAADQNLADMAQRLEAALRRPPGEAKPDHTEPRIGVPPAAPEPQPNRPRPAEISIAPPPRPEAPPAPSPKSGFENLEDEMASLLGRPKSSS
jgi:hypothetical protein